MASYRKTKRSGHLVLLLLSFLLLVTATLGDAGVVQEDDIIPSSSPATTTNTNTQHIAVGVRGGTDLLLPVKWTVQLLKKATIGPLVKPALLFAAKSAIIAYITAEIMAYLGMIGDRGEGLYDWALENESQMQSMVGKWGMRPGGFLRSRLESMLNSYKNLPAKAKFASAVSAGTTAFPFILKTSLWSGVTVTSGFLLAEFLALLGVLGDPGEGFGEWVKDGDAEPILHSFRKITAELLVVLRQKLQIFELAQAFWGSSRNDRVFWAGFGIGATASVVLPSAQIDS